MPESNPPVQPDSPEIPDSPAVATDADSAAPAAPTALPIAEPPQAPATRNGLALGALITGIAAVVLGLIPGASFLAWLPAIAAITIGIIGIVKKGPRRGFSFAGILLGAFGWLIAIVVSIVFIVGAGGSRIGTLDEPVISPTSRPSETVEPEEPSPPPAPAAEPITYSGVGDSVIAIELPDGPDSIGIATITHNGSSNIAVWGLDANLAQQELLVNEIGAYSGIVAFNLELGAETPSLEITADGEWSVTLMPIESVTRFESEGASGTGDHVLIYDGPAAVANLSHAGSSNFSIWSYGDRSDLIVNEIGVYSGGVRWQSGPALIVINADGAWSIAF